jgi:hypothetical protein
MSYRGREHWGIEDTDWRPQRELTAAAARNSAGLSGPLDGSASVDADAILTNSRNRVCGDTVRRLLPVRGR